MCCGPGAATSILASGSACRPCSLPIFSSAGERLERCVAGFRRLHPAPAGLDIGGRRAGIICGCFRCWLPAANAVIVAGRADVIHGYIVRKLSLGLALAATLASIGAAAAQTYPSHPVTLIVPFGAGGPVDTLARSLTEAMRKSLGQPVVIENVTGASGTIGVGRAVRAAPDGYTVSMGNWPSHVVNGAIYTLPYDVLRDFEPVARLPSNPYVVVARKDLPATNLKELIAWLKVNPDKATEGTAGPGAGQHVSGVYFQNVTGTRFQFVPYRAGSSEIMRDLVAGHIDITFDQAITALPHVRSGQVKAFAVTSDKRLAAAPDIPTVDEAGAPGIYISTWSGLWVCPRSAERASGTRARTI